MYGDAPETVSVSITTSAPEESTEFPVSKFALTNVGN